MSIYEALAGVYDDLTSDVAYGRRADYLERLFQKSRLPVRTVLDLACGTGSMTAVLTERGYELIGVDESPDMLAVAREKAAGLKGEPPVFLNQSMPKLDLYGTVEAAVCCLDSLNYLTSPREVQRTFERLALFIAPGGILIFDINSASYLRDLNGQVFLDETDDVYCVWRAEFEKRNRVCTYWMDIFTRREDGVWNRSVEEHRQRAYEVDELRSWLLEAGFTHIRTYGDCRMSAPKEGEQRIYFSAVRGK
ncbi:MAG: class I SAM-dependent methyltransferase [Oscillospiraceae bacterium]|nr:class I SAM-dependent methyltransferase [Oscillospiraceae bacterium]